MKKTLYRIVSVLLVISILLFSLASCTEKNVKTALSYNDANGKTISAIDIKLFSLMTSVVNFQLGTSSLEDSMWDMAYQDGNSTTVKEIVIAQSTAYAKGLLQAEYICDKVYSIGISKQQENSIDKYISELTASFGGEKNLENALSVYGTDIASLKRYMALVLKQDTLYQTLYSENGIRRENVETRKPEYFKEHFVICDHILVKYSGGLKDDGTEIPLDEAKKAEKRDFAKALYNEITNGLRDFDSALDEFNEDTYKLGYPFGYFVPDSFYWTGISEKVQDAALEMSEDEIRFVDTENGAYIIRKNKMNPSLHASNGSFSTYIDAQICQEDFLSMCETADGATINKEVIGEINPARVPPFNIDSFGK